MVIARGSYPRGRKFESYRHYQRSRGQAVKTSPFHGGIMGSSPVGVTKKDDSVFAVIFFGDISMDGTRTEGKSPTE